MKRYTHKNHNGRYWLELNSIGYSDGKELVQYRLSKTGEGIIFASTDFHASPLHEGEGKESASALLSFLTLRAGDIESDYFKDYTPRQLAFSQNEAESLYYWQERLNPAEYR